jgi:membrane fusion protein, heavy metal efflux system
MKNLTMWWAKKSSENPGHIFSGTILLVVMLGAVAFGCRDPQPEELQKTFVLSETMWNRIKLDTAKTRPVISMLELNGKIVPVESKLVEIFPIVGGNVKSVEVELGDYVKKGQLLAVIKSGEVAEYDRQLIEAQSDVLVAQKNLSVQQDLFESKLTSEREVILAQEALEKAEATLAKVQETLAIYNFNEQSEYFVKAPQSGFIIQKHINRDITLPSDFSHQIFTIAELDEVWVLAHVYEQDIAVIVEGMESEVYTLSYPDNKMAARIERVYNVLDVDSRTMKVRLHIPNKDFKLKPEMLAVVSVKRHENISLPSVATSSLVFDNSKHFVMIFKDRYNIETREVEVYRTTNGTTWIKSGIEPGEVVISQNQLFIYDALND